MVFILVKLMLEVFKSADNFKSNNVDTTAVAWNINLLFL